MQLGKEIRIQKSNLKGKKPEFEIGDLVLLYCPAIKRKRSKKLSRLWTGPYRVLRKLGPVNYEILRMHRSKEKKEIIHVDRLKEFVIRKPFPGLVSDVTDSESSLYSDNDSHPQ